MSSVPNNASTGTCNSANLASKVPLRPGPIVRPTRSSCLAMISADNLLGDGWRSGCANRAAARWAWVGIFSEVRSGRMAAGAMRMIDSMISGFRIAQVRASFPPKDMPIILRVSKPSASMNARIETARSFIPSARVFSCELPKPGTSTTITRWLSASISWVRDSRKPLAPWRDTMTGPEPASM